MCKNMRLGRPWGVDQDYYGTATCLCLLLNEENKEMTQNNTPIDKKDGTMQLRVTLPRATRGMWKEIFNKLLNFDARKYNKTVQEVRKLLRDYIDTNEENIKTKLEEVKARLSVSSDRS